MARPHGDRHLWAEDHHGTSPGWWHLALVSRAPGSAGPHPRQGHWCRPRRHQGRSGCCASSQKVGCSAAAAACRERAAGVGGGGVQPWGDTEAEPIPLHPYSMTAPQWDPIAVAPTKLWVQDQPPSLGPTLQRGVGEPWMMLGTSGAPAKTLQRWTPPRWASWTQPTVQSREELSP